MLDLVTIQYYLVAPEILKTRVHHFYARSVEITNKIEAHSKGKYPKEILDIIRPNETPDQKNYRKQAWRPVTKTYFSKAVSTFGKIKKAEDWEVKFEYENKSIPEKESLEQYTDEDFPNFSSVENWLWSFQFNEMFDDPNGVLAVFPYPKENPLNDAEYLRPFPFWFESEAVIDFKENELAVLRSGELSDVKVGDTIEKTGCVYYIFDQNSYAKCIQIGQKNDYNFQVEIFPIAFGYFPCFKIGGIVEEFLNGEKLWDSFMGDCIPFFDEAVARYSDLQVQNVLHVHSEKWEIEDTPCKTCTGSGQIRNNFMGGGSGYSTCGTCNGSGATSIRSPFGVKTVKPQVKTGLNDAANIPIPPMGYINKPIEDTKFIKEQFYNNIENALSAINMEFVMREPGINSGIAKAYDRQEINTTLGNVAWHIIKNILEPVYFLCGMWRYSQIESEEEIAKMVPCINVPNKFDVLTEDILQNRLAAAKTAGASASLLAQLESQYAKKEFGDDSIQAEIIEATGNLDPLPNKTDADKMTILSNGGTTKDKYILSCNLTDFINRAYAENDQFFELDRADQLATIMPYVQEIKDEQIAAKVPMVVRIPQIPIEGEQVNTNPSPKGAGGSIDAALEKTNDGVSLPSKVTPQTPNY